jgi:hypothetical protein
MKHTNLEHLDRDLDEKFKMILDPKWNKMCSTLLYMIPCILIILDEQNKIINPNFFSCFFCFLIGFFIFYRWVIHNNVIIQYQFIKFFIVFFPWNKHTNTLIQTITIKETIIFYEQTHWCTKLTRFIVCQKPRQEDEGIACHSHKQEVVS